MFTLTYDGDSGEDVLAAAIAKLIAGGTGPNPWAAEVTYLAPDDETMTGTFGIVGLDYAAGKFDVPTLVLVDYDLRTYTFGTTETRVILSYVSNVTVL